MNERVYSSVKEILMNFLNLSNYIIDNYQMIQGKIRSNKNYTKLNFQKDLSEKI